MNMRVQKNSRKVGHSMDADAFVIFKQQKSRPRSRENRPGEMEEHFPQQGASLKKKKMKERTKQQGDWTMEQAKERPQAREKGKTKDNSRGKGFSLPDKDGSRYGRGRHWLRVKYDSGSPETALWRDFAEDAVGSGAQFKTATGGLTTDFGGARISGRVHGGPPHRIIGCLVDVHKTLLSLST